MSAGFSWRLTGHLTKGEGHEVSGTRTLSGHWGLRTAWPWKPSSGPLLQLFLPCEPPMAASGCARGQPHCSSASVAGWAHKSFKVLQVPICKSGAMQYLQINLKIVYNFRGIPPVIHAQCISELGSYLMSLHLFCGHQCLCSQNVFAIIF
jgi:hypothetical protein